MSGYHFALAVGEMTGIFIGAIFYSFGIIIVEQWLGVTEGNPGGIIGIGIMALILIALIIGGTTRVKADEAVLPSDVEVH